MKPCQVHIKRSDFVAVYKNLQYKKVSQSQGPRDKFQKKYQCQRCKRSYSNNCSFRRHTLTECGVDKKFVCDYCGHRSKRKGHLLVHIVKVHLKTGKSNDNQHNRQRQVKHKYVCDRCDRSYAYYGSLYTHKTYECKVKPKFVCDYCGFKTEHKHSLSIHISRRHLVKKP